MKHVSYSKYRSTPMGWVGNIPSHWDIEKIKFSLTEKSKVTDPTLPPGAISYGKVVKKDGEKIAEETLATYQQVRAGEFVINPINLNYDLVSLRTALSDIDVVVSPAYIVLKANGEKLDSRFANYLLHIFDIRHMKTLGAGIRQTIGFQDVGNCLWVVPPLEEQITIANFIDRETWRIDKLIAFKQKQALMLREKRDALIIKTTINGLNEGFSKKPSRADWIDSIPCNWEEAPFSAFAIERRSKNIGMKEANLLSLSYGRIIRKDINKNEGLLPESFETYQIVEKDDVIFRFTDLQNDKRSLRSAISDERGIITSAYLAVRVIGMEPHYLNYLMRSYDLLKVFYSMAGGLRQSLSFDDIKRMTVVVPPREEQIEIVRFLQSEIASIDAVVSKISRSIELLREHRTALITAAVTGKIDVRNAA